MARDKMHLEDWLDDLCVRFIVNLPEEDLSSIARICFQIEEAQWFYEDFIRPLDPTLPSMTLRSFSLRIFQHCPLLAPFSIENHTRAFEEFLQYKTRVPVRGAILLNEAMDSTVLVKGWKKGANWSFPRGKINKDEDDLECAIREVYEETGYDLHAAGLVPKDRDVKYIEITMREQQMRLYVFRDVPMDTHFAPRTRKEISKIQWYRLSELPAFRRKGANNNDQINAAAAANANKFYMVAPFLVPLKKWVVQQKKRGARTAGAHAPSHTLQEEPATEDDTWPQSYAAMPAISAKPVSATTGHTPALDTPEGATKELQRLLKGQPLTQPALPMQAASDKGASLLAMLKAGTRPSVSSTNSFCHTTHEIPISQATQSQPPHHPDHGQHQGSPSFPVDLNQQLQYQQQWYSQGRQPSHDLYQQPPVMAAGPDYAEPPLRHPQPLPPQVQINKGSFLNTPSPTQVPREGEASNSTAPFALRTLAAQGVASFGQQQPPKLSNHSKALLGVFTSGAKSQQDPLPGASDTLTTQQAHGHGHTHQPKTNASLQPSFTAPIGAGVVRPGSQVTPKQRATLLDMFRRPDATGPSTGEQLHESAGEAFLKKKLAMTSSTYELQLADSAVQRLEKEDTPSLSQLLQPVSHSVDMREPVASNEPGQNNQVASQPAYKILQRTDNLTNRPHHRPSPLDQTSIVGYASHEKPASLASPPATSSLPTPAILQRKHSMPHEQRTKLLSLFGKPQTSRPSAPAVDDSGKGKDVVLHGASPASGTSGLPSHPPESRRGSQTPISPADRNFLLNYLASATSRAQ